jgi:hypothetical protein
MKLKYILFSTMMIGTATLFAGNVKIASGIDAWKLGKSWKVENNQLQKSEAVDSSLVLKNSVEFKTLNCKAENTPLKTLGDGWNVAAIKIIKSKNQFWQAGLIERPAQGVKPKGHFFELKCKDGKIWGAEHKLKLKRTVSKNFEWKYCLN